MIRLAFYRGNTPTDCAVKLWTRGPYSHVELIAQTSGTQSRCLSSSSRDGGVREKQIELKPEHWDIFRLPWVSDLAADQAAAFITSKIGLPYDWRGLILTQIIPLNIQDKRRWFCSEIVAQALGYPNAHRHSPNSLARMIRARAASPAKSTATPPHL